jgi:hypothetical protein
VNGPNDPNREGLNDRGGATTGTGADRSPRRIVQRIPRRLALRWRKRRRDRLGAPHRRREPPLDQRQGICRHRKPLPIHAGAEHCRYRRLRRGEDAGRDRNDRRALRLPGHPMDHRPHARPALSRICSSARSQEYPWRNCRDGSRASDCHRPKAPPAASPPPGSPGFCRTRLRSHNLRGVPLLAVLFGLVPLSIAVAGIENAWAR